MTKLNQFKIKFDSWEYANIFTTATEEQLLELMREFEKTEEFINDEYDFDSFFQNIEKAGYDYYVVDPNAKRLSFERTK